MVRSAALPKLAPTVQIFAVGQPLPRVDVPVISLDETWKSATSDGRGCAKLDLRPGYLPLAVFIARNGYAAHEETERIPDERALHVRLTAQLGGGSPIAAGTVNSVLARVVGPLQ